MTSSRILGPSRAELAAHRARMRAEGLRPVRIWVPDVRSPDFRAAAHSQSAAVSASASADDDQAFVDAVSDV